MIYTILEKIRGNVPKLLCDEYKAKNLIYGCGKPYELIQIDDKWTAIKCEYK
jgi:hypothetical protein